MPEESTEIDYSRLSDGGETSGGETLQLPTFVYFSLERSWQVATVHYWLTTVNVWAQSRAPVTMIFFHLFLRKLKLGSLWGKDEKDGKDYLHLFLQYCFGKISLQDGEERFEECHFSKAGHYTDMSVGWLDASIFLAEFPIIMLVDRIEHCWNKRKAYHHMSQDNSCWTTVTKILLLYFLLLPLRIYQMIWHGLAVLPQFATRELFQHSVAIVWVIFSMTGIICVASSDCAIFAKVFTDLLQTMHLLTGIDILSNAAESYTNKFGVVLLWMSVISLSVSISNFGIVLLFKLAGIMKNKISKPEAKEEVECLSAIQLQSVEEKYHPAVMSHTAIIEATYTASTRRSGTMQLPSQASMNLALPAKQAVLINTSGGLTSHVKENYYSSVTKVQASPGMLFSSSLVSVATTEEFSSYNHLMDEALSLAESELSCESGEIIERRLGFRDF